MTQTTTRKSRRMARAKQPRTEPPVAKSPSRLDQLQALLSRPEGASIAEMAEASGWQPHSVRGAMAGALKKRGLVITSQKTGGLRRYRAQGAA